MYVERGVKTLYPCDQCKTVCSSKSALQKHNVCYHQYIKCPHCQEIFTNHFYKTNHKHQIFCGLQSTTKTHGNTEYHCPICSETFTRLLTLKRHIRVHTSTNPERCNYCGKFFLEEAMLSRHIALRHNSDKKYFECDMCNKIYLSRNKYKKHKLEHNFELIPPYKCFHCGKTYESLQEFKEHLKLSHGNRLIKRNLTCHMCQQPRMMKYHVGPCHIYICDICKKEMRAQSPINKEGMWLFTWNISIMKPIK